MFDTRNQKSGCDYSGQVLEYVYKELDDSQRSSFESHLDACTACPEEVAAFAAVTGAIGEWKSNRFDILETPEISTNGIVSSAGPIAAPSVISRLRAMFEASPLLWQTASALAAILLTAGLVWIFFGGADVDKNIANGSPGPGSGVEKRADQAPELAEVNRIDNKDSEKPIEPAAVDRAKPDLAAIDEKPVPPRLSSSPRRIIAKKKKPVKSPAKRNKNRRAAPKTQDQNIPVLPRLTDLAETEDSDDDSLRLTELFAVAESDDR